MKLIIATACGIAASVLLFSAIGIDVSAQTSRNPQVAGHPKPVHEMQPPKPGPEMTARPKFVPENFYVITARKDAEFAALRKKLGEKRFEREEGTGYDAYMEWKTYWQEKVCPRGDLLAAHYAMTHIGRAATQTTQSSGACSGWVELGPFDMPAGTSFQRGVGRADWITFDPNNQNNMFTGSSAGGLLYSTDAGATWQIGSTDFLLPNIGAADLEVDPSDSNLWYLATGDGDGLGDNGWSVSHGVLRTYDKGVTWESIGLDASVWWGYQIKKLVIDPDDSNTIIAATSFGLYRTTNALTSPGTNVQWQQDMTVPNSPFYDVVYQPGSSSILYASGTTVLRSTDDGLTWSPLPGIPFLGTDVLRIAMEVTPANPDYLYLVVVEKQPELCNYYIDTNGVHQPVASSRLYLFKANNQSWVDKGPICNTGSYSPDQRGVHSSRAHSIGVSPTNADLIYIGDVNPVAKCTTGGDPNPCNWIQTTNTVHADVHRIKFSPDGLTIYAATDGGMFKTIDGGNTWTPQNNGLRVAAIDTMSTSATDPSQIMLGLFDTGTIVGNSGAWTHVSIGGDGREPIIDYSDPTHMYASYQGGGIYRSDDMGLSFLNYVGLPPPACPTCQPPCPNWGTFYVLNSANPQTVFSACHPEVMRSTTRGGNWQKISNFTGSGLSNYETWKIYIAPSNADYLYAHLVVGTPQLLMRTTNANLANTLNVSWNAIPHPSAQWISSIDVDEADPDKFWLSYGGFLPINEKVYYYDHGNWTNLTANLATSLATNFANMSVNTIVHERGSDRLFIGTNLGVYTTRMSSLNWTRVGGTTVGELPYVEVTKLEINYVNNTLRAATHGRGLWETRLYPCPTPVIGPDAVIRDSDLDIGNEPDNETGPVIFESKSIWVRNVPDHMFTTTPVPPRYSNEGLHENPEYSSIPINTPWIYAKVHNNGSQPVSGHVEFYYGKASTGLDWGTSDWTLIGPVNAPSTIVTSLAPGGDWVVSLQWTTIPVPPSALGDHYCLLARFVADPSTPDPINGEVSNNGIAGNVVNSNNIAWKNVTIVNDYQNKNGDGPFGGGEVIIRNISRAISQMQLHVDFAEGSEAFLKYGTAEVDLGDKLFSQWRKNGRKDDGLKAIGPTTIAILKPHAVIGGLTLSPREQHTVTIRIRLNPRMPIRREFTMRVTQFDRSVDVKSAARMTGGESFVIQPQRLGSR